MTRDPIWAAIISPTCQQHSANKSIQTRQQWHSLEPETLQRCHYKATDFHVQSLESFMSLASSPTWFGLELKHHISKKKILMISFWGSSALVIERNESDRNVCPEGLFTPIGIGCTDFKFSKKSWIFQIFSDVLDFYGFCWVFFRIFFGCTRIL